MADRTAPVHRTRNNGNSGSLDASATVQRLASNLSNA